MGGRGGSRVAAGVGEGRGGKRPNRHMIEFWIALLSRNMRTAET